MKNYNEILSNENIKIEEVRTLVDEINENIVDNVKIDFDVMTLKSTLDKFNEQNKIAFARKFVYALKSDRVKAFNDLLAIPYYNTYGVKIEDNKTITIKDNTSLFSFVTLEKTLQGFDEKRDKNGHIMLDKGVTVFGALRFYGLMSLFIRNLQKSNFEIDKECNVKLDNVVVDNEKIFVDVDGKIFASNSNNSLEKQLNVIVKFFGYDVQMLKKDLPILKIKAQKIKQDKKNAKFSVNAIINDNTILKFVDVIFGVIASRINNEDIEIITQKATTQND